MIPIVTKLIPDRLFIYLQFKKHFGYFPNLNYPKAFNEKMQWLKLNVHSPVHTQCSDKYEARFYIAKTIGEKYLVPLIYQSYVIDDDIYARLPNFPCVIKTNQDCGGLVFVYDKNELDWKKTKKFLKKRLGRNHYNYSREWQYKDIKPCIIVEKLLLDKNEDIPFDYKVYCFNGKAKMIAIDLDRNKNTKARNWYDMDWQKQDIFWNTKGDDRVMEKPLFFDEMIELSEKLAKNFLFIRVDWYNIDGNLFAGELTLHPGGGMVPFYPEKWENTLGSYLRLPVDKSH